MATRQEMPRDLIELGSTGSREGDIQWSIAFWQTRSAPATSFHWESSSAWRMMARLGWSVMNGPGKLFRQVKLTESLSNNKVLCVIESCSFIFVIEEERGIAQGGRSQVR